MDDLENFRESIASTFEAVSAMGDAQRRFAEEADRELQRLWADNAELRDELHALANRVESLTRARLTEPAEVAGRIMAFEPRRERGFCRFCDTTREFTEGKCDYCATPIVGVGEKL